MKVTIIKDFKFIMKDFNLYRQDRFKGEVDYQFDNGSHIRFLGLDRADIGKGLRSDLIFFNEANKIKFDAYREIAARSKCCILDYNPNFESYIERHLIKLPNAHYIRLTFRDNEFLPENEVNELLSYKQAGYNEDGTIKDEYYANLWNVYGEGLLGRAIGAIYTNWTIGDFIETDNTLYGLDFGFSSDPDALCKVSIDSDKKIIYLKEELYQNGNSTDTLLNILKDKAGNSIIVADSAEDRLISDLRMKGLNIIGAKKNKVVDDIKVLQSYRFIVDENSLNLQNELNNYIWLDKEGKSMPIDKYNHILDSVRYATMFILKPKASQPILRTTNRSSRYIK